MRAATVFERLIREEVPLVIDAEVLQEILHRYTAIKRTDAIQPAFDALLGIIDEVFTVGAEDVIRAKYLLPAYPAVSARDTVHAAVMKNRGVDSLLSFDSGFDRFAFISRIA